MKDFTRNQTEPKEPKRNLAKFYETKRNQNKIEGNRKNSQWTTENQRTMVQNSVIRGHSKKSESWAVHLLFCWLFLLFYSNSMHKWWIKVWFLTCQMLVLSGRTNFDPFLKTWKFFTPKFPMKYSKNGQNFTALKNT